MPAFLLGPDGLIPITEIDLPPCPECHCPQTTLSTKHKMSCGVAGKSYQADMTPRPSPLFEIPWDSRKSRWVIEWRWKRRVWVALLPTEFNQTKTQSWNQHQTSLGSIPGYSTKRQATNYVARLRKMYPGKSFRVIELRLDDRP